MVDFFTGLLEHGHVEIGFVGVDARVARYWLSHPLGARSGLTKAAPTRGHVSRSLSPVHHTSAMSTDSESVVVVIKESARRELSFETSMDEPQREFAALSDAEAWIAELIFEPRTLNQVEQSSSRCGFSPSAWIGNRYRHPYFEASATIRISNS